LPLVIEEGEKEKEKEGNGAHPCTQILDRRKVEKGQSRKGALILRIIVFSIINQIRIILHHQE